MTPIGESIRDGLSDEEAARRLIAAGPNELPTSEARNLVRQVWDVVRQPMLFLLIAAGLINFLLAEPLDGMILMLSVLVVLSISIVQERKTEHALAALRDLSSPRALVVRGGRQRRIAGREVVVGDVVLLAEGDRVPADCVLVDGMSLTIDEAALTGESVPVRKRMQSVGDAPVTIGRPGGDDSPWLFSGTLVVKGHGVGLVGATGAETELGRIGAALRTIEPERSPLQLEIDRIVRVMALLGLGASAVIVVLYALTRGGWLEAFLAGVAAAMSLLPEEFPVVLTVFVALGAWRMSKRHVLVRRSAAIETLGSATAICVDKTGTLTLNRMRVRRLVVDDQPVDLDAGAIPERCHEIVEFAALASPLEPFDPMDRAFRELDGSQADVARSHEGWVLVREYPLSEKMLAMCHVWRSPGADDYVVAAKGAPEAIADLCHLDEPARASVMGHVEAATGRGLRVIAVARASFASSEGLPPGHHDFDFELLGVAGLMDPVRPGVAEAIEECGRAGIRVIMITGDYPGTALSVAREIGLDHATGYLTGTQVAALDADALTDCIGTVNVFARMVPDQKLGLVRALQAAGEVVAMTGDGVNDAPALRAADIGIAMGGRGTDVARESASVVITDDDFSSIVAGIRRGRGIYDNLRKAMAFLVAVHVPIFGMALAPVFVAHWPLVLLPVQIAFLELIIDPACSIVFESDEHDPRLMDDPPRGSGDSMFGRRRLVVSALQGVSLLGAVFAVYLGAVLSGRPADAVRSVTFSSLVLGNLALILVNRSWRLSVLGALRERRNPTLKWILLGASALLVTFMTVPGLRRAFRFGAMRPIDWLMAVGAGAAGVAWFELYKVVRSRRSVRSARG